jgi:hypothetical protein
MTTAPTLQWFKSSYSGGSGTECVEAAFVHPEVLVRDSKAPERPYVAVSVRAWRDFLAVARRAAPKDF